MTQGKANPIVKILLIPPALRQHGQKKVSFLGVSEKKRENF